jgi:hypothetical protein
VNSVSSICAGKPVPVSLTESSTSAALTSVLTVTERQAGYISDRSLKLLLATALIVFGVAFPDRTIGGDGPWRYCRPNRRSPCQAFA